MRSIFSVDDAHRGTIFSLMTGEVTEVAIGSVLAGKYRVERTLGVGGMGVVFAAKHVGLDRLVAVKVMRIELRRHPEAVERLTREAKLAARFQGDNICRVLDVGMLECGAPYIVMEYLDGVDLATLLRQQGPLDIETAVDFMLQVCVALAEAHRVNVVHRDLKPENIFVARAVDGTPTIKVLDFGISKDMELSNSDLSMTNPSLALGSPHYMAPEQMRSARDVDARVDVWSVGAILFELVTGRPAFCGDSLPEIYANVLGPSEVRVRELHAAFPPGLASAIDRALAKDPALRFKDVGELAAGLAPYGSSQAQESRERVDRSLSNNGLGTPRLAKDPSGRYVLAPNPRSPSGGGISGAQGGVVVSSEAPSAAESSRVRKVVPLLVVAALACLAAAMFIVKTGVGTTAVAAASAGVPLPAPTRVTGAGSTASPPAKPVDTKATKAGLATPPAASGLAPVSAAPARRSLRPGPVGPAATPVTSAPPRLKKPSLADAWDASSFGPRN